MYQSTLQKRDRPNLASVAVDVEAVQFIGISPQDPDMVRLRHTQATLEFRTPLEQFFNAYSRWAGYEYWAPEVQGPGHWLVIQKGGAGSQFVRYDKFILTWKNWLTNTPIPFSGMDAVKIRPYLLPCSRCCDSWWPKSGKLSMKLSGRMMHHENFPKAGLFPGSDLINLKPSLSLLCEGIAQN